MAPLLSPMLRKETVVAFPILRRSSSAGALAQQTREALIVGLHGQVLLSGSKYNVYSLLLKTPRALLAGNLQWTCMSAKAKTPKYSATNRH